MTCVTCVRILMPPRDDNGVGLEVGSGWVTMDRDCKKLWIVRDFSLFT